MATQTAAKRWRVVFAKSRDRDYATVVPVSFSTYHIIVIHPHPVWRSTPQRLCVLYAADEAGQ